MFKYLTIVKFQTNVEITLLLNRLVSLDTGSCYHSKQSKTNTCLEYKHLS